MSRHTAGGETAPTDLDLTRLLQTLTVESDRYAERFGARHGLHRTDVNALALILAAARRGEPMSPTALAKELGLSPSATTALIDRLEAVGHVRRERPAGDRRRVALTVPEAGLAEGRKMFVPLAKAFAESWADFGPAEREVIARFLDVSTEAMRTVGAEWTAPHEPDHRRR
ncbi:MarR family transcriptional regulator [Glycomyces sp. TRM65418]|uniref:MarR family winged helix-turn-helix transcriptional regulator n=1 Tax=Glycomyces sp. TRM65418 TaxID=2867006 RepID=UPI001CE6B050|nr:MarR family transcriptional regulator [Glycomyces sp. TRM65418]MCC3764247.1 MarR family transcriptional regulator [Glycomyces sp. TRM65418]QZD53930.1 MarR family transcriptional regulator [Glycomyces sp. TRM65418]